MRLIGHGVTERKVNGHMRQTVGELNQSNMKSVKCVDSEIYFTVYGYRHPRNIEFYAEQCLGPERAYTTPPWTRLVIVWKK